MGLGLTHATMTLDGFARNGSGEMVMEFTGRDSREPNLLRSILMTRDQLEAAQRNSEDLRTRGGDGGVFIDNNGDLGGEYLLEENQLMGAINMYNSRFPNTQIAVSSSATPTPAANAPTVRPPAP